MSKCLSYKGVTFDWWETNDDGLVFSEMCHSCASKNFPKINLELDDGSVACASCGVKGCSNDGNGDEPHYYIDFDDALIEFIDCEIMGGAEQ